MSEHFNADEVFQMAEKIEKNGVAFYRKAAEIFSDNSSIQTLMNNLASMEEEHRIIYAAMRSELSEGEQERTIFDPENQVIDYLNAIADKNVFDTSKNMIDELSSNTTIGEVLRLAIGAEKDSIIFYLGMKDMIPEKRGKAKIDEIIEEEKKHIVMLSKQLKK